MAAPHDPESDEDRAVIHDARRKLDEILQRAREQLAVSTQLRAEVREIHERILRSNFFILPRAPDRHPRVTQRKGRPR